VLDSEDAEWQGAVTWGNEVPLLGCFSHCFWHGLVVLGMESSGSLGPLLVGCTGSMVPLGDWSGGNAWLGMM
jgi:hypothetical protein